MYCRVFNRVALSLTSCQLAVACQVVGIILLHMGNVDDMFSGYSELDILHALM